MDFNTSAISQYDKPHNTDDADVQPRIAKWAAPSICFLLSALEILLSDIVSLTFYKDAEGNDIVFDGGIFELSL